MSTENNIAKTVGALFIITMILGMIDAYTGVQILNASLADYGLNEYKFYMGAFSILLMFLGVVGMAILLFPVLEKQNRIIAITYQRIFYMDGTEKPPHLIRIDLFIARCVQSTGESP